MQQANTNMQLVSSALDRCTKCTLKYEDLTVDGLEICICLSINSLQRLPVPVPLQLMP